MSFNIMGVVLKGKKMKKVVIILVSSLLMITFVSCQLKPDEKKGGENTIYFSGITDIYDKNIPILNTFVSARVYGVERVDEIEKESFAIMSRNHKLLDNYHYYYGDYGVVANIKIINDSYGTGMLVDVDKGMIEALEEAILMMKLSEGYFNPFMGSLIDLWNPKFSPYPIENNDPLEDEINKALACVPNYKQVEEIFIIDKENSTILFKRLKGCDMTVSINLGGFVKGYTLNEIKEHLNKKEISYLFNLGNSSIYLRGQNEEGKWRIGTTSPYNSKYAYVLVTDIDTAISTSGDDNKFFLRKNEDGSYTVRSHLLNPFTGYSESNYRVVTVISEDNLISEVLSTTLFVVSDLEEQRKIINNFEKHYNTNIHVIWYYEENYGGEEASLILTREAIDLIDMDTIEDEIVEIIIQEEKE